MKLDLRMSQKDKSHGQDLVKCLVHLQKPPVFLLLVPHKGVKRYHIHMVLKPCHKLNNFDRFLQNQPLLPHSVWSKANSCFLPHLLSASSKWFHQVNHQYVYQHVHTYPYSMDLCHFLWFQSYPHPWQVLLIHQYIYDKA